MNKFKLLYFIKFLKILNNISSVLVPPPKINRPCSIVSGGGTIAGFTVFNLINMATRGGNNYDYLFRYIIVGDMGKL